MSGWGELCRATGKDIMTAAEAIADLGDKDGTGKFTHALPELRAILAEWSRDGGIPSARVIGNRLNKVRGRATTYGALDFGTIAGNRYWFVRPVRPPSPEEIEKLANTFASMKAGTFDWSGGSGGSGDSATPHAGEICTDKCNTNSGGKEAEKSHQNHQSHQGTWTAADHANFNFGEPPEDSNVA